MSDETTQFILGDAAVDAMGQPRKRRFFGKKKSAPPPLTHCENCDAQLAGEYCARCGQHAVDYRRSLWRVLIDAADSFLNWDTKFASSIWVLLVRPWKLTNDFNAGRRARYVHPLRLYLLASIAFFLMIKLAHLDPTARMNLKPEDRAEIAGALARLTGQDSVLTPEQRAKVDAVRTRLTEGDGRITDQERHEMKDLIGTAFASKLEDKIQQSLLRQEKAQIKAALARIPEAESLPLAPVVGAEGDENSPPSRVTIPKPPVPPAVHPLSNHEKDKAEFEGWLKERIKGKIGGDGTRGKLFFETLRNNIPTMMLCCIPLFALVLKMLYLRQKRYYVEHLVYALHIHTFAYFGVLIITLIGMGLARFSGAAQVLVCTLLAFALFGQVLFSIRHVYKQGWFFTTFKFLLGGVAYFVILIFAVGVTAFVTLLFAD
jgi:hypothetical protein